MDKKFVKGNTYFQLSFLDDDFKYPIITSLIFLGRNIEANNQVDQWFFQDPVSYLEYGPYDGVGKDIVGQENGNEYSAGQVFDFPEEQLHFILTVEELIDELA